MSSLSKYDFGICYLNCAENLDLFVTDPVIVPCWWLANGSTQFLLIKKKIEICQVSSRWWIFIGNW